MNAQLAFQLLQLANTHDEPAEEVVARALTYAIFIMNRGEEKKEGEAPVTVERPIEPGVVRRKRRTKEEMQRDEGGAVFSKEPVRYEDIQAAMMRLFERRSDGMEIGRKILGNLGVATLLDLKPEQYAECLILFQDALDNRPIV